MLNLNIKSSSYMCLDIDQDSVIHKHLRRKVFNLDKETATQISNEPIKRSLHNKILLWNCKGNLEDYYHTITSKHNLTMLPSFHISLGAPLQNIKPESINPPNHPTDIACLVGLIHLSPIHISKNKNKKSAWIPIDPTHIKIGPRKIKTQLHISLANLTGEPRDSIACPEDCIIDTINN